MIFFSKHGFIFPNLVWFPSSISPFCIKPRGKIGELCHPNSKNEIPNSSGLQQAYKVLFPFISIVCLLSDYSQYFKLAQQADENLYAQILYSSLTRTSTRDSSSHKKRFKSLSSQRSVCEQFEWTPEKNCSQFHSILFCVLKSSNTKNCEFLEKNCQHNTTQINSFTPISTKRI